MCFCTLDDVHMSTLLYSKTFISPAKSIWFTKTGRQNLGYIKSVLDHQGRGHLEATLYQRTVTHEDHWDCQTLNMLSKYNFPRYHYCLSYIYAEVLLISPIRELYRNRYYLATKLTFNNNNCVIVFKKQTAAGQTNSTAHIWLAQLQKTDMIWGSSLPKHTHLGLTWDRCVFALPEQNRSTIHPHVPAVGTHGYICWHTIQGTITEKIKMFYYIVWNMSLE